MMRIDSIASHPDRALRYTVKVSNGTVLHLYRQTVEDFGLYQGLELDKQTFAHLLEAAGQMSAKMRAVRIVSATSVSKKDLERRLVYKGEDPEQARQAVEWMEQLHLVDDEATAKQVVERCIAKGYGIARAKQALYEKRITRQYWDVALSDYPDQSDFIISFIKNKLGNSREEKDVRRVTDALIRRGFGYGEIRQAFRELDFIMED